MTFIKMKTQPSSLHQLKKWYPVLLESFIQTDEGSDLPIVKLIFPKMSNDT